MASKFWKPEKEILSRVPVAIAALWQNIDKNWTTCKANTQKAYFNTYSKKLSKLGKLGHFQLCKLQMLTLLYARADWIFSRSWPAVIWRKKYVAILLPDLIGLKTLNNHLDPTPFTTCNKMIKSFFIFTYIRPVLYLYINQLWSLSLTCHPLSAVL